MHLTYHSFVEHRSSGMQDMGTASLENIDLIIGGLCSTSCQGNACSCSCSCTAAINTADGAA